MTFDSETFHIVVVLFPRKGLGARDVPTGEGFSPDLMPIGGKERFPVRFLDFPHDGRFGERYRVPVILCHQIKREDTPLEAGVAFDVVMGMNVIGEGQVLD
jgi:hypothetical protein